MSARNYMPYIPDMMEHIQRIYEWNQRVDEMRINAISDTKERMVLSMVSENVAMYHIRNGYDFQNGLRMYYEERSEYTTAKLENNLPDQVDALVDQFVVAIGEIRKCALSESYEHIEFWESRAKDAYWQLTDLIQSYNRASNIEEMLANDELLQRCFREVTLYSLWSRLLHWW